MDPVPPVFENTSGRWGSLHWYAADVPILLLLMFHKAHPVDFPLCQELEMIVRFVKYQSKPSSRETDCISFGL